MRSSHRLFPLLGLLLGVFGCANPSGPLSLSLTELGSEVQEDAGSNLDRIRHRRSHNITGLGSMDAVGMLTANPDPALFRWPSFSRKNLPDQMAPRVNAGCSRVAVHDLAMAEGRGMKEVIGLRDSLEQVQAAQLDATRVRAELLVVDAIVKTYVAPQVDAQASSSTGDAKAEQPSESRQVLILAWRSLTDATLEPKDEAGWRERGNALAESSRNVQTRLRQALEKHQQARAEQGLVVARWEYDASRRGGLEAVGLSAAARSAQTRTGFVVLGHPRTLTLIAGDDLLRRACGAKESKCDGADKLAKRSGIDTMIPLDKLYTTTFMLLAEHVAWAESGTEERQLAFSAKLSAVIGKLSAPGLETLKSKLDALDVHAEYESQSRTAAENLGAVSGSRQWDAPFSFWNDDAYQRSVDYQRALNSGFVRIVSMRTTLDGYATNFGGTIPSGEDPCTSRGPTAADLRKVRAAQLGCESSAQEARTSVAGAALDSASEASRRIACDRTGETAPR